MSRADDIVQDAIDLLERPDLHSLAVRMLRRALLEFHGCDNFDRDKVILDVAVSLTAVELSEALPVGFRSLFSITGLRADEVIVEQFKERRGEVLRDYFGYKEGKTWMLLGSNLNLRWDCSLDTIRLGYYGYPTWSTADDLDNPGQLLITTDSWIVNEFDEGLLYKTLVNMAMGVDKGEEAARWEVKVREAKAALIRNYGVSGLGV